MDLRVAIELLQFRTAGFDVYHVGLLKQMRRCPATLRSLAMGAGNRQLSVG